MFSYQILLVIMTTLVATDRAQIVPLSSYCHDVDDACTCEPQSNLVRVHCPYEYAMIMEVSNDGVNIAMSYYSNNSVTWLPRFDIDQVSLFEFDAYNYWSETFFRDLLSSLGVQEVLSVQFRDRSMETEVNRQDKYDSFDEFLAANITNTWYFSPVPALEYFKFESTQQVLPVSIFQAFNNLTTLELRLAVRDLPTGLFSSISHSLQTLSIVNPHMFHFRPEMLWELQQLRNLSLMLSPTPANKSDQLRNHIFTSMLKLEELRLSRANNHVDAQMFRGSYRLRFIHINKNNQLTELPSELFVDQGNLTFLDLSCNSLSKLPVDLFESQGKLKFLDLSSNRLASLSSELFGPLKSLKKLAINQNSLTALDPTTFAEVRSLNFIDMRGTQFYGVKLDMPFEALVCTNDDICQYKSDHWECDPHCICWVQHRSLELIMDCRGAALGSLPPLPHTRLVTTVLKLKNNSISELPESGEVIGYANVSQLNLSDNELSSLDALRQLPANLTQLDVRRNLISVLDQTFIEYMLQENNTMNMFLAGNPLICDCNALPLLGFVRAQPQRVSDIGEIYCPGFPDRPFQQLEVWELCPSYVLLIGCILGGLVIVACLISVFYLIYQQELKIWLYNHNCCLWWVSEEELDKDKTYDAFISYSHKDEQIIGELLPKLENGLHAFRVCLHGRDWLVGDCIPEQIVRTVNDSKRVIIVLSQHFIDSVWARMEFRIAYQATLQDKRKRIIIILYKELQHFDGIDSELRAYLKLNTYLKWGDPLFWNKLHYAMPHNRRVLKGQKKHAGPLI
ncbi:protein toll [Drosophila sulfurigaster albostrigata]|uniref:protein toll n=1 Tax=Drosophila sulfurigaster albostrigata TaxID=89887 RepID=UPI002D21DFCF|nr:protein toll [Drosophila sulfurigaster albostrigata]